MKKKQQFLQDTYMMDMSNFKSLILNVSFLWVKVKSEFKTLYYMKSIWTTQNHYRLYPARENIWLPPPLLNNRHSV